TMRDPNPAPLENRDFIIGDVYRMRGDHAWRQESNLLEVVDRGHLIVEEHELSLSWSFGDVGDDRNIETLSEPADLFQMARADRVRGVGGNCGHNQRVAPPSRDEGFAVLEGLLPGF